MPEKRFVQLFAAANWPALRPLFAQFVEPRSPKLVRGHYNMELHVSLEQEKPGFRVSRNLGRTLQVNYHDGPQLAVVLCEIH
jgi:hypothetical protein